MFHPLRNQGPTGGLRQVAPLLPALILWAFAPDLSGAPWEVINQAFDCALFGDFLLWDDRAADAAQRLRLPQESKTESSESYRLYPRAEKRILGARPYSVALYGRGEKVERLSFVFANIGDYAGFQGDQPDLRSAVRGFREAMERDTAMMRTGLSRLFGQPRGQFFGEGPTREKILRWDWNGHSFLLSNVEGEYVSLAIETPAFADDRGRSSRVPDAVIRERARGFVERRENGDVVISNIPMVDQGPKGYCVPATAERCMRFLGIPADMYLLAMAGQTQAGGGTSVEVLLSHIGRDIKRKGRSFEIESGELELRDIKRSIDDGIPIMWAMQSTPEFNDVANDRTESRQEEDWSAYKERVAAEAESTPIAPRPGYNHVVIIMGYNEETEEIAFSDSWGPRYKERWITVAEAQKISSDRYYIIDL